MRSASRRLVPVTRDLGLARIWAATIDFTPDHLPILGPGARRRTAADRAESRVASAGRPRDDVGTGRRPSGGGPVVHGATDLIDVDELGLDRFDADGRSRLAADPIALPFPPDTGDETEPTAG